MLRETYGKYLNNSVSDAQLQRLLERMKLHYVEQLPHKQFTSHHVRQPAGTLTAPIVTKDLQTVSPEELAAAKAAMNTQFEANRIRPDSDEFQYDLRREFEPDDDDNSWDEE